MDNTFGTAPFRSRGLIIFLALALFAALMAAAPTSAGAQDTSPVIENTTASDLSNSANAARLVDGNTGTDDNASWQNPNPWDVTSFPMIAEIDLGATYQIDSLRYFVGNLVQGEADVLFEVSSEPTGEDFSWLGRQNHSHVWNEWSTIALSGPWARRVRVTFLEQNDRFNISELEIFGTLVEQGPPADTPTTTTTTAPPADSPTTTTTTAAPVDSPIAPTNVTQPRSAQPGPDIVRAHGFGNWPNDHLSAACIDLHDRYWIQGQNVGQSSDPNHPDNLAYHTWHPAIEVHPDTGETCDYGHEHGTSPLRAPADVFELSGGWPAFGYAAAHAGPGRHEDHAGHKVTVAHFRAAIGNGSGDETLFDAGFECDWLSKIHQGSHSMDAFANHLHEYFLTVRCFDGENEQGVQDGQTVGTAFSIKVMFTYGRPNRFVEENCAAGADFDVSVLVSPDGNPISRSQRETPLGNNSSNDRAFVCSDALVYRSLDQDADNALAYADLWNELIKIESPDGSDAMTIQPYYMVKNPSRVIEGFPNGASPSQVVRTIDLCYGDDGAKLDLPLCQDAPASNPGWDSPGTPFNGALRAVHFKAISLQNGGGPSAFCTNAFGRRVDDPLPCEAGNIEQRAASYNNDFNNGQYSYNGNQGNIAGSIWAEIPGGERTSTVPLGGGAFAPNGVGFEFVIDNRNPDDDGDGIPDGANLRGQN